MIAPPAYSQGEAFLYKDYDWDEFYDSPMIENMWINLVMLQKNFRAPKKV